MKLKNRRQDIIEPNEESSQIDYSTSPEKIPDKELQKAPSLNLENLRMSIPLYTDNSKIESDIKKPNSNEEEENNSYGAGARRLSSFCDGDVRKVPGKLPPLTPVEVQPLRDSHVLYSVDPF